VLAPTSTGRTDMLFKGNSSRLQLLIEKIQSNNNKENNDEHDIEGTPTTRYPLMVDDFALGLGQGHFYGEEAKGTVAPGCTFFFFWNQGC
jgi:hypothetical protein